MHWSRIFKITGQPKVFSKDLHYQYAAEIMEKVLFIRAFYQLWTVEPHHIPYFRSSPTNNKKEERTELSNLVDLWDEHTRLVLRKIDLMNWWLCLQHGCGSYHHPNLPHPGMWSTHEQLTVAHYNLTRLHVHTRNWRCPRGSLQP